MSFWGDELESIDFDGRPLTHYSIASIQNFEKSSLEIGSLFTDIETKEDIFLMLDMLEFHPLAQRLKNFSCQPASFNVLDAPQGKKEDLAVQSLIAADINALKNLV